jgi:PPOX class probable F420-dependent enzyme
MRRLVEAARVGRLATVSADHRPHAVPVCYALRDQVVYSAVDHKPKRHRRLRRLANLRATGQACLLVDEYREDWSALWWVRVDGHGRVVDAPAEADRARAVLADKYPQYREWPPEGPVIALEVTGWSGWSAEPLDAEPPDARRRVQPLTEQLDLRPHPEGGWFRETWRSPVTVTPPGYPAPRAAGTAIYFLLHPGEESRWHVVRSAEVWLWHHGGPLTLRLGGTGDHPVAAERLTLGPELTAGQQPQLVVPGGVWQSAEPAGAEPVLVSCVVAPGFDEADFRLR